MLRLSRLSFFSGSPRCVSRSPASRAAFTLIELMVVIAIIAMLATMAFRGIMNAKKTAIRMSCSQRMRDLAVAMTSYDIDKQGYPGYRNVLLMTNNASYVDPFTM